MLDLHTLGELSLVAEDGRELHSVLAQPKRVALVAYLASPSTPPFVPRETLVGLFWPERDEEHARGSLRSSLYFLRRSLGSDVVVSRHDHQVGLDPERLRCDAAAFEALLAGGKPATALELYGGEYLRGFVLEEAPPFERWLEAERRRLSRRAHEAALGLAQEAAAASARPPDAERWARRALAIDPWDEAALRLLMEALDARGRRAEALRAFHRFTSRLKEDLRLEPSPETMAAADRLREGAERRTGQPTAREAVTSEELEDAPKSDDRPALEARTPAVGTGRASRNGLRAGRARRLAGALGIAFVAVLIWQLVVRLGPADGEEPAAARAAGRPGVRDSSEARDARRLDARRILVAPLDNRTGDSTLDPLGRIAADWLTQGLARTGLVRVAPAFETDFDARYLERGEGGAYDYSDLGRRLAERARAGLAVTGSYFRRGDSLAFDAQILDVRTGEVLRTVEGPAVLPVHPLRGVDVLRRRLLGAVGTVLDPRLASWSAAAGQPPSYDAYLRYARGLDLFFENRWHDAALELRSAGDLQKGFAAPLVWAVFAFLNADDILRADSLLRSIRADSLRLAPWDRAVSDYLDADVRGDWQNAYEAARRVLAVSPGSEWAYKLAFAADALGRHREAARILEGMDPDRGWARKWSWYWDMLAWQEHLLGAADEAERVSREGLSRFPDDRTLAMDLVGALAARGEIDSGAAEFRRPPLSNDVDGDRALDWWRFVSELRVHGHEDAARREGDRALAWDASLTDSSRAVPEVCLRIGLVLEGMGRLDQAASVFRLGLTHADGYLARSLRASLGANAAARGDTAAALRALAATDTVAWRQLRAGRREAVRALILANLGRLSQAVDHLRSALDLGWGTYASAYLHQNALADPLRGYAPYEALMRGKTP